MDDILECDYLVVGGGTAGCVVAARLSEDAERRVVVIEAGEDYASFMLTVPGATAVTSSAPRFNWSAATEPEPGMGNRSLYIAQGKVLGGGSSINGMVYTRGQPWDYDHWRSIGCEGWGFEDVLPLFRKSEASERGANRWHGDAGPLAVTRGRSELEICEPFLAAARAAGIPSTDDLNAGDCHGLGYYDAAVGAGRRSSTAGAFIGPAQRRPNLTVRTGALATRLLVEAGRVVGCEYRAGGATRVVRAAREVVVANGALRTPQLLMLSGLGPAAQLRKHGITVHADLPGVGANLMNHVSYKLAWRCTKPVTAYRYLNPVRGIATGLEYLMFRTGYLSHPPTPIGGFLRSDDALAVPDLQIFMNPAIVGQFGRGLLKLLPREHGITLFVNQGRPWSRGEVRLASADPAALPRVFGNYFSDGRDLDVLARGAARMRDIVRQSPLAPYIGEELLPGDGVKSRADLEAHIRANGGNHWHVSGTCRMGGDAGSVVDPRLRVRGVEGLRIADASVMPTLVNGNTAAPIIMIGEKAAEMIAADNR